MFEDKPAAFSPPVSRSAFRESYLNRLLPLLTCIQQQGSALTMRERLRAIKLAADMSLALTAGDVSWSRALSKQLSLQSRHSSMLGDESCEHTNSGNMDWCKRVGLDPRNLEPDAAGTLKRAARRASCLRYSRICKKHSPLRRFSWRKSLKRTGQSKHTSYLRMLRNCVPRARAIRQRKPPPAVSQKDAAITDGQITSLREVIPGGSHMNESMLLKEAADYISSLQMQIEALQLLAGPAST